MAVMSYYCYLVFSVVFRMGWSLQALVFPYVRDASMRKERLLLLLKGNFIRSCF